MKETIMAKSAQFHSMLCTILTIGNVEVEYKDEEGFVTYCRFFGVVINGGIMRDNTHVFYIDK